MTAIMFVCKKNSRRSQMAEAFARSIAAETPSLDLTITSSGLEASYVDPIVVEIMAEVGLDLSSQGSKALSDFRAEDYDWVISLCGCGVNLPEAWQLRPGFADWQLDDPEGESIDTFRRVRDEVKARVIEFLASLAAADRSSIET